MLFVRSVETDSDPHRGRGGKTFAAETAEKIAGRCAGGQKMTPVLGIKAGSDPDAARRGKALSAERAKIPARRRALTAQQMFAAGRIQTMPDPQAAGGREDFSAVTAEISARTAAPAG